MRAPTPLNEPARVDTLRELELLDTEAEGVFDDIVLLAAHVCGTPIALMSLVDAKRQWFKARVGVDVRETDRDSSFCAHGILKPDEMMIVPDATKDARFADNPLVLGDPQIRFYAGAPLVTHDGHALGTLCVIDRQPRELTAEQEAALRTLRRSLVAELELRRATRALARSHQELDQRVRDRTAELQAGKEQFRTLVECTHDMVQSVDRDGRFLFVNELWRRTLGHDEADVAKARVFDVIHPDSLAHCQELFQRVMQGESVSDIEAKFRAWDGRTVIVEGTVAPLMQDGAVVATHGFFRDVTERKHAESELRSSEQFNRVVLASLGAHLAVLNRAGTIIAVNDAWQRFARANEADPAGGVGVGADYLEVCRQASRTEGEVKRILEGIETVLAGTRKDFAAEYPCHAPGERRWFYMRVRPLPEPPGGVVISHENVTERKLAEEALRDVEMRLRLAAEASDVGFWDWDMGTNEVYYSPEWKRLLGYGPGELRNHYEEWESRLHPDDRDAMQAELHTALGREAGDYSALFRLRHKDGSYRWILARAQLTRDTEGRPRRMMGCHVDLTDLKHAQEQLAREKQLSDDILASLPGMFYAFTAQGRFVRWNHRLEAVSGYTGAEIAQMRPEQFFEGEDAQRVAERMAVVFAGGESTVEADFLSKDGTRTPFFFTGRRIEIDGEMCLAGLGIDVTDMKRAQAALVASEAQYRGVFNTVSDCLIITRLDGMIVDVNEATCRLHGYTREQLRGAHPSLIVPEGHREKIAQFFQAVATGRSFHGEAGALTKNGTTLPVEVHGFPFAYRGEPHALAVLRDISERKRVEEELHDLSARLLTTQDEERRRLARELHDTTAQKLAGAAMNLSILESALKEAPAKHSLHDAQELVDGAAREIRTLSYLLHPPLLDELGLDGAVRDYAQGFAQRSGIKVTLDLAQRLGRLSREQETALFRILQESLGNIHRHSGSLTAHVALQRKAREMRLVVSDTGRGLSAQRLPETGEGITRMGVGIAGMRERLRQLGGRLELASDAGGTTVTAILPVGKCSDEQDTHPGGG